MYLDVSALGRPFDDQSQPGIRLETEALFVILEYIQSGRLGLVRSFALQREINANPNSEARLALIQVLEKSGQRLPFRLSGARERIVLLRQQGVTQLDAVHVAVAESVGASFVMCDYRLIRTLTRIGSPIWIGTPTGFCDREEYR